jgi:hypothetical protein
VGLDGRLSLASVSPNRESPGPPGRQALLLPGHPLPSPSQEMGGSENQCYGIKSSVKCCLCG